MTKPTNSNVIKQVESNINLDDCEVTEIWLINEGKPVLDLGLLLDFKDATSASASFGRFKRND